MLPKVCTQRKQIEYKIVMYRRRNVNFINRAFCALPFLYFFDRKLLSVSFFVMAFSRDSVGIA